MHQGYQRASRSDASPRARREAARAGTHQTKARLKAEPLPKPDGRRPMGGACDETAARR